MPQSPINFGIFPDMGEEEQVALQLKIPLFQLVYPKRVDFDKSIIGPYGVKITIPDDPDLKRVRPHVEWLCSGNAQIKFQPVNKRGLGVAWMPDDPWWHNRLILMHQDEYMSMLRQLRLPDGTVKDGAEVKFEILCMKKVLMGNIRLFRVLKNGQIIREVGDFLTKQDAEAYIERVEVIQPVLQKDGTIRPMKMSKDSHSIVEIDALDYKPEIKKLIASQKGRNKYGWTECSVFQNELRPKIISLIKEGAGQFKKETGDIEVRETVKSIEDYTDDEIRTLKERILALEKRKPGRPSKQDMQEVAA